MPFTFPRVIRIGHVVLSVTDLTASRHFYVDLLGFHLLHETGRALYLRGVEDREWSLKLELGTEPGLRQLAYKAGSEAALDEIAALASSASIILMCCRLRCSSSRIGTSAIWIFA